MSTLLRQKYKLSTKSSGTTLANELGIRIIGKDAQVRGGSTIINWGCSSPIHFADTNNPHQIFNHPEKVKVAVNKLLTYEALEEFGLGEYLIPHWKSLSEIPATTGARIVARTKLTGSCGDGIVIFKMSDDDKPEARLYTKYIKNRTEFRVHVCSGATLMQRKRRLSSESLTEREITDRDLTVRNVRNGYIYSNDLGIAPEFERVLSSLAVDVIEGLGLDFGAVDLCVDSNSNAFVFEVNTSPGLKADSTLHFYTSMLGALIGIEDDEPHMSLSPLVRFN